MMVGDEDAIEFAGTGDPAQPPAEAHGDKTEVRKQLKEVIRENVQVVTDKEGRLRKIAPARVVRDFISKLIDELAGKSCAEHIKEIHMLREEAGEIEERWRDRLIEAEKKIEVERGKLGDFAAKLAAALAENEVLRSELEALRKQLSGQDQREKGELLKIILQLEARVFELEMAIDYFDLEEEFDEPAFRMEAESMAERLAASPDPGRQALSRAIRKATTDASAAVKKFAALRPFMDEGKGSVSIMVDMIKQVKEAEAARGRAETAGEAL